MLKVPISESEYEALKKQVRSLPLKLTRAREKYRRYVQLAKDLDMLDILEPEEKDDARA